MWANFEIYTREVGPIFPLLNIIIIFFLIKFLIIIIIIIKQAHKRVGLIGWD